MRSLFKLLALDRKDHAAVSFDSYETLGLFFAGKRILKIKKTILRRSNCVPYLIRYSLLSTRFLSIKLHHILTSDDQCLHDHPWAFISILLKGKYAEEGPKNKFRIYGRGNVLFRRAKWKHRLLVHEPVWSLVFTFRKSREWGFWTKRGFIPHDQYDSTFCD